MGHARGGRHWAERSRHGDYDAQSCVGNVSRVFPDLSGLMSRVSGATADKMTSESAIRKSPTPEIHMAALESMPELAKVAIAESFPDRVLIGILPRYIDCTRLLRPAGKSIDEANR